MQYGIMLMEGKGVIYNKEETLKYFKRVIEKGNIGAIYYCGCIYDYNKLEMYDNERLLRFQIHIYTEEELKNMEQHDIENFNKALYYYKLAINKGHIKAMNNSAFLLTLKNDSEEDNQNSNDVAIFCFKQAADKGDVFAIYNYAHMCYFNNNYQNAFKYY